MFLLQHFTKYFDFCVPLGKPTVSLKDYGSWQLSYCRSQMVAMSCRVGPTGYARPLSLLYFSLLWALLLAELLSPN